MKIVLKEFQEESVVDVMKRGDWGIKEERG